MPCLMRGSLMMSSRTEAPAERRTGAREASCAGLARSEAAARAAHRAAPGIPLRSETLTLPGSRSGRGRRTIAAASAARPQRHKRGAILTTNLPTGGSRQPASASSRTGHIHQFKYVDALVRVRRSQPDEPEIGFVSSSQSTWPCGWMSLPLPPLRAWAATISRRASVGWLARGMTPPGSSGCQTVRIRSERISRRSPAIPSGHGNLRICLRFGG